MTTEAIPYRDGHCQTHGKPDQYHGLCAVEYRTQFGVLKRCDCPNHANDDKEESAEQCPT